MNVFFSLALLFLSLSLAPTICLSWWMLWQFLKDAPDRIRRGGGPKG